jgi:hypothetical protein
MFEAIQAQAEVTASNLVHEAAGRMGLDPQTHEWLQELAMKHLIVLRERFPGTSAAERAKVEIEKITAGVIDDVLSAAQGNLATAFQPIGSNIDANRVEAETLVAASQPQHPNDQSNAQSEPNGPSRSLLPQQGKETRRGGVFAACLGLVALAAIAAYVARRRAGDPQARGTSPNV